MRVYVKSNERNYVVRKNDYIKFNLFTNNGEILVDPTSEFTKQASTSSNQTNLTSLDNKAGLRYLVKSDGTVRLPLIGNLFVENLTLYQLDSLLSVKYAQFYQDPFVISNVVNRRVFVLGTGVGVSGVAGIGMQGGGQIGIGGGGSGMRVIELENESITIFEIIAKMGGVGMFSDVKHIKVIRNYEENKPLTVNIIDLSTIKGTARSDLKIYPNDVVFIEPGRRPVIDFIRELSIFAQIAFTASTVILLINQLSK